MIADAKRRVYRAAFAVLVLSCLFVARPSAAEEPLAATTLTNIIQIWRLPAADRHKPHRLQCEVIIYSFDRAWNYAWGECEGEPAFLPIGDCPIELPSGTRVFIDGIVNPLGEKVDWSRTTVRVLGPANLKPLKSPDLSDPRALSAHLVELEGIVDSVLEDATHLTMRLIVGPYSAMAYAMKGTNAIKATVGDVIRLTCVFTTRYDSDNNLTHLSFFMSGTDSIQVIGNLANDPRFLLPLRESREIRVDTRTNELFVLEGIVRKHDPGKALTIWDETGQIVIRNEQTLPVHPGQRVRAIGYPRLVGIERCLVNGLYVPIPADGKSRRMPTNRDRLFLADQVRELTPDEAALQPKVSLRAIVTWAHEDTPFAFVQDPSGGIKVLNPTWVGPEGWKPGTIVDVEGTVVPGDFVPAITNAVLTRSGFGDLTTGPLVSFEQAWTGAEDGNWIEMRGYVRELTKINGLAYLDLSTAFGEFRVWTPGADPILPMLGSVIRVSGVCSALANSRHQLTDIEIWSPEIKLFKVEEPQPADLFALPLRPIPTLRQFSIERALNRRVRTTGTVVLQVPGRYVRLQDGSDALFALTHQPHRFEVGDRVEVVGFPGTEGGRLLLREAVFRHAGKGAEPQPVPVTRFDSVNVGIEGLLAETKGTLFNIVHKNSDVVLLIQSGASAFEARLDASTPEQSKALDLELGSEVSVTGIYEVQRDEHGMPRSFSFQMRSPRDAIVLQRPPWWTFARLLGVTLAVLVVFSIAVIWALLISRKNKLLHHAQMQLKKANDELEQRVEERTQELRHQVEGKERARAELALTQRRLIAASRQAGMAEVATGVLHNVGNVLNSVNVSATLLSERVRNSRAGYVAKCGSLLKRPAQDLARFLTEDPRGKSLPDYLAQLGQSLDKEKTFIQGELDSLAKNIDHIKVIVAMQQSHAKSAGVLEELDVKDLVEDAIHINSAAIERHRIRIVRDYQTVPSVLTDRHKVLQILINLISNAKWALNSRENERTLTLSLSAPDPQHIRVVVRDNGIGIAVHDLNRIFTQGFTTRKDGHGFGLHSGANAARELGGSLSVHSEGIGLGATFTLELPVRVELDPAD